MKTTKTPKPLEQYEPERTLSNEEYLPFIGTDKVEELKRLAEPLDGASWAHVNSTFQGGGCGRDAEEHRSAVDRWNKAG